MREYEFALDFGTIDVKVTCYDKDVDAPIKEVLTKANTPCVACVDQDELLFGNDAINYARLNNKQVINYVKLEALKGAQEINYEGKSYSVCEILKGIVTLALNEAVSYLSNDYYKQFEFDEDTVINLCITYPAVTNCESYIQFLKDAVQDIKLNCGARLVVNTIAPEPVAGGVAFLKAKNKPENVVVIDIGGGTSDFSYMNLEKLEGGSYYYKQKLPALSLNVGGKDWNAALKNIVIKKFAQQDDDFQRVMSMTELCSFNYYIEQGKLDINLMGSTTINNPYSADKTVTVTKEELFKSTQALVDQIVNAFDDIVVEAREMDKGQTIDNVVLTGGGSLSVDVIDAIKKYIKKNSKYFSSAGNILKMTDSKFAIVTGAGLCSHYGIASNEKVIQTTNHCYGVEAIEDQFSVKRIVDAGVELPYSSAKHGVKACNQLELRLYGYDKEYNGCDNLVINLEYYIATYTYKDVPNSSFSIEINENNEVYIELKDEKGNVIKPDRVWGKE